MASAPVRLALALALALGVSLLLAGCASGTAQPTAKPAAPAAQPTAAPAAKPAAQPTAQPAAKPAAQPTAAPAAKAADDYPTKPINIIVPFDSGGSVDRMARGLATYLSQELKTPITVENKPGAGAQLGHTYVQQQPDDGYTLMVTPVLPYMANNILLTNAKFKISDFAFLNAQWIDYTAGFVHKDKPWQTMGELIEEIKKNPKKLSHASSTGAVGYVALVVMLDALGIPIDNVKIVTYESGGDTRTSLAGGQVDFVLTSMEGTIPVRDKVRCLAVFLDEPHPEWPGAPPINQVLKPYGVTMPPVVGATRVLATRATFKEKYPDRWNKLMQACKRTLEREDTKKYMATNSIGTDWLGPEKSTQLVNDGFNLMDKYKDLMK